MVWGAAHNADFEAAMMAVLTTTRRKGDGTSRGNPTTRGGWATARAKEANRGETTKKYICMYRRGKKTRNHSKRIASACCDASTSRRCPSAALRHHGGIPHDEKKTRNTIIQNSSFSSCQGCQGCTIRASTQENKHSRQDSTEQPPSKLTQEA